MVALLVTVAGSIYASWQFVSLLYTAAMHDYVLGYAPVRRVYRDQNRGAFKLNVILAIIMWPIISAGGVILVYGALKAEGFVT